MNTGNYLIADLQQVLKTAMTGVSTNVFTDRPTTVPTAMADFVLVEFPSSIYDHLAYGKTSCRVSLYARDTIVNNINYETVLKLKAMQTAAYAKFPITDTKCLIGQPRTINNGSDKLGFHYYSIILSVTIN